MSLALIAGWGKLPGYVARSVDGPVTVAALEGADVSDVVPERRFRVERLGTFIAELKDAGVTDVCFAGAVARPALDPKAVDAATMPLVPRMMQALQQGDDAALRVVLSFFEEAGIAVKAAQEIVPHLLPPPGVPTRRTPDDQASRDAERGAEILVAMGAVDVGQAVVVHRGQALAIEATPGTDWMLKSIVAYRDGKRGGLLFKGPKPGQDRRVDMPTIGPSTVSRAEKAGLDGIVVAAGDVLVIDSDEVVRRLDERDMFLWVRE